MDFQEGGLKLSLLFPLPSSLFPCVALLSASLALSPRAQDIDPRALQRLHQMAAAYAHLPALKQESQIVYAIFPVNPSPPNPLPTGEGATYPQPPPDTGRGYQSGSASPFPVS